MGVLPGGDIDAGNSLSAYNVYSGGIALSHRDFPEPARLGRPDPGVLFCGILQRLCPGLKTVLTDESRIYFWEYVLMPVLLVLCVISLVANTYNPFIYFRF